MDNQARLANLIGADEGFRPFYDANHDFACLEYIRSSELKLEPEKTDKLVEMMSKPVMHYRIGDYARALLLVI